MLEILTLDSGNATPMTPNGNHTYLVLDAERAVLIDAGLGDAQHLDAIDEALAARSAHLDRVIVTHSHRDHAGGAEALAARHPRAFFLKYPDEGDRRYPVRWQALGDKARIAVGREEIIALHTPGHSPDHLAFWHDGTRTVFTGDLVIPGGSVMIEASSGGRLADYLSSLKRVLELRPKRLLPAHGPEAADPPGVLIGHLEHRNLRERQIVAALAAGRDTVQSIAESIYDDLSSVLLPAARENVCAHLEKLESEGRVVKEHGRWRQS